MKINPYIFQEEQCSYILPFSGVLIKHRWILLILIYLTNSRLKIHVIWNFIFDIAEQYTFKFEYLLSNIENMEDQCKSHVAFYTRASLVELPKKYSMVLHIMIRLFSIFG